MHLEKYKHIGSEKLLVLYIWGFVIMKPLLNLFPQFSTLILGSYISVLLSVLVFIKIKLQIKSSLSIYIYIIIQSIFFLLDYMFRPTNELGQYIYYFIINGLIPVLLLNNIGCKKEFISYYYKICLVISPIFMFYPILGEDSILNLGDYMAYGYNFSIPCMVGLYLGYKYSIYKRLYLVVFILQLICIILFANRASVISVMFIVFFGEILLSNKKKTLFVRYSLITAFSLILAPYLITFLVFVSDFLDYSSYSLNTFNLIFDKSLTNLIVDDIEGSRSRIWTTAITSFYDSPLIGKGTSWLSSNYGNYAHNYFLDVLSTGGILMFIIQLGFISRAIYLCFVSRNIDRSAKIILYIFLCLAFPKLFFSQTYIYDLGYICFLSLSFMNSKLSHD